jgi:hypothetical protein
MGEDEEGAVIGTAEDEVDGALGYVDATDELAIGAVDLHLTRSEVDIACLVLGDTFAAGVGEELHIGDRA